jgi:uncharacterized protein (TIGR02145 family)
MLSLKNMLRISGVILIIFLTHSCKKEEVPTATTAEISNIASTSATCGGEIISEGTAKVITRGVCWSTNQNPTISDNITKDSTGSGTFISHITGLTVNTTYYVRAYASNNIGTNYGNQLSFTTLSVNQISDDEGNIYNTIKIGTQIWMKENLKTKRYRNGDLIVTTNPSTLNIMNESNSRYQWAYDGNEINVSTYGRLYTWYVLTDSRSICPTGWHVPTDAEWTTLQNYLIANGFNYDGYTTGNKLAKSLSSTSLWAYSPDTGNPGNFDYSARRNATGFTALPSGYRFDDGSFQSLTYYAVWWSATDSPWSQGTGALNRQVRWCANGLETFAATKTLGFSVRCVKNN